MSDKKITSDQEAIARISEKMAREIIEICIKHAKSIDSEGAQNMTNVQHSAIVSGLIKAAGSYMQGTNLDPSEFKKGLDAFLAFDPFLVETKLDS